MGLAGAFAHGSGNRIAGSIFDEECAGGKTDDSISRPYGSFFARKIGGGAGGWSLPLLLNPVSRVSVVMGKWLANKYVRGLRDDLGYRCVC